VDPPALWMCWDFSFSIGSNSWPCARRQDRQSLAVGVNTPAEARPGSAGIPTRILVTGSDLLSGALASALETRGFATTHIAPNVSEIERGIAWRPDLVLFDVRSFDVPTGSSFVEHFCRAGLQVCVIDVSDDNVRRAAWLRAGPSEVIDGREPFDHLFMTITRLLRVGHPARMEQRSPASVASAAVDRPWQDPRSQFLATLSDREFDHLFQTITRLLRVETEQGLPASVASVAFDRPWPDPRLQLFATLTDREEVVLAELLEGHCAEEIAKTAFVSISTIRSQIKSILQKLGVNSQLAAVALARRAGWSLDHPRDTRPRPANARRSRAS
jgi:DNA-binding NarL/FixJ family response regulator